MSLIINGRFIKGGRPEGGKVNAQYKANRHDMQRLDHRMDVIQPRKNGKPNPDFIQAYPDNAKQYFSQQELERYGNG